MTDHNNLQVKLETSPSPDVSNFQFTFVSPHSTPFPDRFGQTYPADISQALQQRVVDTQAEVKSYYPSPMSYSDGDGIEGWDDIGGDIAGTASSYAGQSSLSTAERNVRRRSSKGVFYIITNHPALYNPIITACDQCRKSKCKCERTSPSKPCKNCIILGTGRPLIPFYPFFYSF